MGFGLGFSHAYNLPRSGTFGELAPFSFDFASSTCCAQCHDYRDEHRRGRSFATLSFEDEQKELAFSLKISSSISSRVRSSGSTLRRLTHLSVRSRILPASTVHAHDTLEHSYQEVCLSHSLASLVLPSPLCCSLLPQQFPFKTMNVRICAHTQTRRVTISRRRKVT